MKLCLWLSWAVLGTGVWWQQTSIHSPQELAFSTEQFRLLTRPRGFALQFVSNGKTKQVAIPREWLIPPQEEKEEKEGTYVSSFNYDTQVTSFPVGNGKIGLQVSSFAEQAEGSAQAAAGRDVFLLFDPGSSAVFRGGIERGVTKERVRYMGCFTAKAERYYLADVDGDGLSDIGVVKEELQCLQSKKRQDVDLTVGPFYKQDPVAWYVFKGNGWKLEPSFSGKFPEHSQELPLAIARGAAIGIDRSPVDYVGCNIFKTCDRAKWPTGESD